MPGLVENLETCLTLFLRAIHREIRVPQDLFRPLITLNTKGDTDTRGNENFLIVHMEGL